MCSLCWTVLHFWSCYQIFRVWVLLKIWLMFSTLAKHKLLVISWYLQDVVHNQTLMRRIAYVRVQTGLCHNDNSSSDKMSNSYSSHVTSWCPMLTHWPQDDASVILKVYFLTLHTGMDSYCDTHCDNCTMTLLLGECHRTSLIRSQHWFR